ncbi:hypothetical protein CROQUDRAFT_43839 [Cronartium quercuum f. sp. fusiforme G11]|uniref:CxC1-like cysteine cluster associated with KDZ transposases domain-containing protein n=1 Tax=Cronartium quercuum f. sp. fusiforme G11 TaxID=708437 RepID=A0A9P6TCL8_9BASI|nr:hypothetical protein CROQUDRAFT_43839 [Cronartium quercuum f. sp. fusiforme G11]
MHNAERHKKTQDCWASLENSLLATYLKLLHKTLNWTSQESYTDVVICCLKVNMPCTTHTQAVDLIDLTGCQCKKITFCLCCPDPIHLLHLGYLPGSPQHPCTGFLIQLVQFYNIFWKISTLSPINFIKSVMHHLHSHSHSFLNSKTHELQDQNLSGPFKACITAFQKLQDNQQ